MDKAQGKGTECQLNQVGPLRTREPWGEFLKTDWFAVGCSVLALARCPHKTLSEIHLMHSDTFSVFLWLEVDTR